MMRTTGLVLLLLLTATGLGTAYADDAKLVRRLTAQNRIALEELDLDEPKAAQARLVKTLTEAVGAGLDKHAVAVTARVYLAIVLGDSLSQPDAAIAELKTVLELDPACQLPPSYRKGKTQKLLEKIRGDAAAEAAPPVPARAKAIEHERVNAAKEGEQIALAAKLSAEFKPKRVTLHYRAVGAADFVEVELVDKDGAHRGEIPIAATATNALEYYIAAWNAKGKLIASEGNQKAPVTIAIVRLVKSDPGGANEDEEKEDENPLAKGQKK